MTNKTLPTPPTGSDIIRDLPIEFLVVDPKDNTRLGYDKDHVVSIASSIKEEGQKDPIDVMEEAGHYRLVAGFTRHAALTFAKEKGGLERKVIPLVRVLPKLSLVQALTHNMLENVARKNLSTFELANGIKRMIDASKKTNKPLEAKDVAKSLGMNVSYINNLQRYLKNLPPPALERWEMESHPDEVWEAWSKGAKRACTTEYLNRWSAEGLDADSRLLAFKRDTGQVTDDADGEGGGGDGGGGDGGGAQTQTARPGKGVVDKALENVKAMLKRKKKPASDDYYEGIKDALNWCAGKRVTIPDIYPLKPDITDEEKGKGKKTN